MSSLPAFVVKFPTFISCVLLFGTSFICRVHLIMFYIVENVYSKVRSTWGRSFPDFTVELSLAGLESALITPHTARVVDGTCRKVKRVDSCNLFPIVTVHEIRKCTSVPSVFALYSFFILWTGIPLTHTTCVQGLLGSNLDLDVEYAECGFFVIFPSSRRQMVG